MAEIRQKGEALNLAHSGLGAANHLCGMLLQSTAGTKLTGVVFRGSAPAITDMMAGRIDVFCDQATNTATFLRGRPHQGLRRHPAAARCPASTCRPRRRPASRRC
jgi:tripartite-type tricarboxylate transporter receptor subunit TctC